MQWWISKAALSTQLKPNEGTLHNSLPTKRCRGSAQGKMELKNEVKSWTKQ